MLEFEGDFEKRDMLELLRTEVENACNAIDSKRFEHEPAYVSQLLSHLNGKVLDDGDKSIDITIVNDRGSKSAESLYGADFAITLIDGTAGIRKAILGQAKWGACGDKEKKVPTYPYRQGTPLANQIKKMHKCTDHFIYFELPEPPNRMPKVCLTDADGKLGSTRMSFASYLTSEFVVCRHGDRDVKFVDAVQNSGLRTMEMVVSKRRGQLISSLFRK